jgi:hypothetical protein
MPITILDLAIYRGVHNDGNSITAREVEDVGLPFLGGCAECGAVICCGNAAPAIDGYLRCLSCIGDDGYNTVEEANFDNFPGEYEWRGPTQGGAQ